MVGHYIPGLVLSYSAGECREQVWQGNSSRLLPLRMHKALKPDLCVAHRSGGLDGEVIKGRLILGPEGWEGIQAERRSYWHQANPLTSQHGGGTRPATAS